jgi:hypothetical protein
MHHNNEPRDLDKIIAMLAYCLEDVRKVSPAAALSLKLAINELREIGRHGEAKNNLN